MSLLPLKYLFLYFYYKGTNIIWIMQVKTNLFFNFFLKSYTFGIRCYSILTFIQKGIAVSWKFVCLTDSQFQVLVLFYWCKRLIKQTIVMQVMCNAITFDCNEVTLVIHCCHIVYNFNWLTFIVLVLIWQCKGSNNIWNIQIFNVNSLLKNQLVFYIF